MHNKTHEHEGGGPLWSLVHVVSYKRNGVILTNIVYVLETFKISKIVTFFHVRMKSILTGTWLKKENIDGGYESRRKKSRGVGVRTLSWGGSSPAASLICLFMNLAMSEVKLFLRLFLLKRIPFVIKGLVSLRQR